MKRLFVVACLAVTMSFSATFMMSVPSAHAMNVANLTLPVSGVISNPCDGQSYGFSGYFHIVIGVTGDMAGGFHLDVQDNTQGIRLYNVATGQQVGVGSQTDHETVNLTPGASNETLNGHFTEITQGSSPNFIVTYLMHITVNADDTVTAYIDNYSASCQG